jgi:hypothetical protein
MIEPLTTDSREAIRALILVDLANLLERIEAKRVSIRSWDNYGKDTFLAFDSYNLGLTEARDMLGALIISLESK